MASQRLASRLGAVAALAAGVCLLWPAAAVRPGPLGTTGRPLPFSQEVRRAGPALKLPAEVKAEPGMVLVTAETEGKEVRWYAVDPGLQVVPSQLLKDSKTAVCFGLRSGRYRLLAYTAQGDQPSEPAVCVVVLTGPGPLPPPPGPVPEPSPDNPFAAAWRQEAHPERVALVQTVAALYDGYAAKAKSVPTGRELFTFMSDAYRASSVYDAKAGQGKLPVLVAAVNGWLAGNLKLPAGGLADADREAASAACTKIARWLRELR